jgi:hypothetical protein
MNGNNLIHARKLVYTRKVNAGGRGRKVRRKEEGARGPRP